MKKVRILSILVLMIAQSALVSSSFAQDAEALTVSNHKVNHNRGKDYYENVLQPKAIAQGVIVSGGLTYYYGDFEPKTQFSKDKLGGNLNIAYVHPIWRHLNVRLSLLGGYQHGERKESEFFRSGYGELALGLECYPFINAGLYFYAGIAANTSFIKYDFGEYSGKTIGLVPVVPLEIGYTWYLGNNCFLSVYYSWHPALIDKCGDNMNFGYYMDGKPLYPEDGGWENTDGYHQFGFSFSYRLVDRQKFGTIRTL